MPDFKPLLTLTLTIIALLVISSRALAHPPVQTSAAVDVTATGEITITIDHDALAFALNETSARVDDLRMYQLLDGPEQDLVALFAQGRERFRSEFQLLIDGKELPFEIAAAPDEHSLSQWKEQHPQRLLPCRIDFIIKAKLPAGAEILSLRFPHLFAKVILIVRKPSGSERTYIVSQGEPSPEINLVGDDAANFLEVAWQYVVLGYTHIIPEGADHCLFVLGLFLLTPRIKPVLWQITAFTAAHTVTLTLTSLGYIGLPAQVVEPIIAASIAFIGIENLLTRKVHNWRLIIAFIFGLVHGMGIAGAFNEAGFPSGQLVTSLAAFTIGVEAGHITVLIAAFLTLGWFRNKPWYRKRIAIPLSMVIVVFAMMWVIQRLPM